MSSRAKFLEGFTLIELSIVLVIIGLLVGSIIIGASLIRASEIRSIITQSQAIVTSVNTFRIKYVGLPGDITNATTFWGNASTGSSGGDCADNDAATGVGTQTCNGNGDSLVGLFAESGSATNRNELFRFWQHLANAEMIPGPYTGVADSGSTVDHLPGVNSLASRVPAVGWGVLGFSSAFVGDVTHFNYGRAGNTLFVGKSWNDAGVNYGAFARPDEAWDIDAKLDDGRPAKGKVFVHIWDDCTDATSKDDLNANYLLSLSSRLCAVAFPNAF